MIKSTISEIVLEMINFVRVMRNELRHHGQAAGCVNRPWSLLLGGGVFAQCLTQGRCAFRDLLNDLLVLVGADV
jgi:hypothetical protein